MFNKILIANRGEIACRVARTCRQLGVLTVAVYSDADAQSAHVASCDEAVHIGPSPAKQSYLDQQRIIDAAIMTGAQAIHPGYGFLSENAQFAQACAQAGLVFIGAPASSIQAMGSKAAAKALMMQAGVPLVPGYHGDEQDAQFLKEQADQIGYPVMIKASAGGGGKGMRLVKSADGFMAALQSCKREALSSFSDDHVLVERYVNHPRHIEVQVFADRHGNCVYLFDRDCSVQRRHQKVLEEAPAPMVADELRQAMGRAAVDAALAVGYEGAGTVEFIVQSDEQGNATEFFFMEMNTRLQVEHPVTEMVTGEDLVAWQLQVACGLALPKTQSELILRGHAIEARVYAENPEKQFLPSVGTLQTLRLPATQGDRLRVDSGIRQNDAISPYYDPMIAKIIAWGEDRLHALAGLSRALEQTHVVGVKTNVQFLLRLLTTDAFTAPNLSTGLIEQNSKDLFLSVREVPVAVYAALVADQLMRERQWLQSVSQAENSPWLRDDYWTLCGPATRNFAFVVNAVEPKSVLINFEAGTMTVDQRDYSWFWELSQDGIRLVVDGHRVDASVYAGSAGKNQRVVFVSGCSFECAYVDPLEIVDSTDETSGALVAPMPGKVLAVHVRAGDTVLADAPLMVIEAMKMEHTIHAPNDGLIEAVHYAIGDQVSEGIDLLTFVVQEQGGA